MAALDLSRQRSDASRIISDSRAKPGPGGGSAVGTLAVQPRFGCSLRARHRDGLADAGQKAPAVDLPGRRGRLGRGTRGGRGRPGGRRVGRRERRRLRPGCRLRARGLDGGQRPRHIAATSCRRRLRRGDLRSDSGILRWSQFRRNFRNRRGNTSTGTRLRGGGAGGHQLPGGDEQGDGCSTAKHWHLNDLRLERRLEMSRDPARAAPGALFPAAQGSKRGEFEGSPPRMGRGR